MEEVRAVMFPELAHYPYLSYDTETTGLRYRIDRVFGFSISLPDGQDFYWDIRQNPEAASWLRDEVRHYRGKIICHNASFDWRFTDFTFAELPLALMDDTCIRACCIDEHLMAYDLDSLSLKYLKKRKDIDIYQALADIFGGPATRNVQMQRLKDAPVELVAGYAKTDTRRTIELWEWQEQEIERQGIRDIVEFERDKMPTFIRAEKRGIRVDLNYADEAHGKLTPIIEKKQAQLNSIVGANINVNSPPQVKKLFNPQETLTGWVACDGTPLESTKSGNASLGAEALRKMKHPAAAMILDIRSLIKTRDTFINGHVIGHAVDGRVYPTINQSKGEDGGTGTGRLSYQEPAMQQIPSRNKEVAAIIKPCFLPDEGQVWLDCDESSFEVRVFAHLVNNPIITQAYRDNPELDLHQFVADITNLVRNATYSGEPNAKQLNLSMIFNSGNGAIADKMGMPWEWNTFLPRGRADIPSNYITYKKAGPEAMAVIEKYHAKVQGVKQLADKAKKIAESRGYVKTFTGRRLRFPNGYKSYKASGLLIQATAADINKENWKDIEDELGSDGHLILNTHDSYGMSLPENWRPYWDKVKSRLEGREGRTKIRVPLILEFSGVGKNWWDASQGEVNAS